MKPVIVGTAGHIDHGKTALVKALTGIDTGPARGREAARHHDRARLRAPRLPASTATSRLASSTSPATSASSKHGRRRRGVDCVLLVVAADDGIMPQTREHFDICGSSACAAGIIVLTKSDLVDPEMLEVVRLEIGEFLRALFPLENAPIVPVSSLTGAASNEPRTEMARISSAKMVTRDSSQISPASHRPRLHDEGDGTVITGTMIAGSVAKEDEVEAFAEANWPVSATSRSTTQTVERALAGQRTASNLTGGGERDACPRDDARHARSAADHKSVAPDVQLNLLLSAETAQGPRARSLHCYTGGDLVAEVRVAGSAKQAQVRRICLRTTPASRAYGCRSPGDRLHYPAALRRSDHDWAADRALENALPSKRKGCRRSSEAGVPDYHLLDGRSRADSHGACRPSRKFRIMRSPISWRRADRTPRSEAKHASPDMAESLEPLFDWRLPDCCRCAA